MRCDMKRSLRIQSVRVNESTAVALRLAVAGALLGRIILEFPFMPKGVTCLCEPLGIIPQRLNLDAGKVFDRAGGRMSQRLQQTEADQDGDVVRFKAEAPGGFSRSEPPRKTGQAQDFFAFGIHGVSVLKLMVTAATWVLSKRA